VSLLFFHKAQPEFETFFDKFYGLGLRTTWDMKFVQYLVYTILLGLVVSVMGMGLSRFRARRKTDPKKQLILLGVLYLLLFGVAWILL
jgi:cation transporter-like permease